MAPQNDSVRVDETFGVASLVLSARLSVRMPPGFSSSRREPGVSLSSRYPTNARAALQSCEIRKNAGRFATLELFEISMKEKLSWRQVESRATQTSALPRVSIIKAFRKDRDRYIKAENDMNRVIELDVIISGSRLGGMGDHELAAVSGKGREAHIGVISLVYTAVTFRRFVRLGSHSSVRKWDGTQDGPARQHDISRIVAFGKAANGCTAVGDDSCGCWAHVRCGF